MIHRVSAMDLLLSARSFIDQGVLGNTLLLLVLHIRKVHLLPPRPRGVVVHDSVRMLPHLIPDASGKSTAAATSNMVLVVRNLQNVTAEDDRGRSQAGFPPG